MAALDEKFTDDRIHRTRTRTPDLDEAWRVDLVASIACTAADHTNGQMSCWLNLYNRSKQPVRIAAFLPRYVQLDTVIADCSAVCACAEIAIPGRGDISLPVPLVTGLDANAPPGLTVPALTSGTEGHRRVHPLFIHLDGNTARLAAARPAIEDCKRLTIDGRFKHPSRRLSSHQV